MSSPSYQRPAINVNMSLTIRSPGTNGTLSPETEGSEYFHSPQVIDKTNCLEDNCEINSDERCHSNAYNESEYAEKKFHTGDSDNGNIRRKRALDSAEERRKRRTVWAGQQESIASPERNNEDDTAELYHKKIPPKRESQRYPSSKNNDIKFSAVSLDTPRYVNTRPVPPVVSAILKEASKVTRHLEACRDDMRFLSVQNAILLDMLAMAGADV